MGISVGRALKYFYMIHRVGRGWRRDRWMHMLGGYVNGWMDGGIDQYYT